MLEHSIGSWVTLGMGTILFFIGKFFGTIASFERERTNN